MTRKIYRTAQGKTVDLGALMLQNENTRAVGNMKVNARGDLIDGWNRPIDRRTQQVQKQYDRQVTNVQDGPVASAAPATEESQVKPAREKAPKAVETAPAPKEQPQGLAAAIARAQRFRGEPPAEPKQPEGPKRI